MLSRGKGHAQEVIPYYQVSKKKRPAPEFESGPFIVMRLVVKRPERRVAATATRRQPFMRCHLVG